MQTAAVDLLDIDPFELVPDEMPWGRVTAHLPGKHPQERHGGDGVDLTEFALDGIEIYDADKYKELYGDVRDDAGILIGDGVYLMARYFENGDMHVSWDLPDGKGYQVLEELDVESMRQLADDIESVLDDYDYGDVNPDDYEPTDAVFDIDSDKHNFYIYVDRDGDVRIDPEGGGTSQSAFDISATQARDFVAALNGVADSHEDHFEYGESDEEVVEAAATRVIAHRPGGKDHDQSSHGRKGLKSLVKKAAEAVTPDGDKPRAPRKERPKAAGPNVVPKQTRTSPTQIELPRQNQQMTLRRAAQGTNPRFGTTNDNPRYRDAGLAKQRWTPAMGPLPSGAYEQNCSNCINAFEMRMRGYDVRASPLDVLDKYGYAGGRTFGELDEMIAASWRLPNRRPHGRSFASQQWRSFEQIDAEVAGWPEGGRGVITTGRHIFNVVNVKGKAQYVESQFDASPTRVVTTLYKRKYRAYAQPGDQRQEAKLIRLDDLEPAAAIRETVEAVQ